MWPRLDLTTYESVSVSEKLSSIRVVRRGGFRRLSRKTLARNAATGSKTLQREPHVSEMSNETSSLSRLRAVSRTWPGGQRC